MHLATAQEPVVVGPCVHLTYYETITGAHLPHHFAIAKGIPVGFARCVLPTGHASGPQAQQKAYEVIWI